MSARRSISDWSSDEVGYAVQQAVKAGRSAIDGAAGTWATLGTGGFPRYEAYSARATRPTEKAISDLRRFGSYGQGWDGYSALPPACAAIRDAEHVLSRAKVVGAELHVVLDTDGSVSLRVEGGKRVTVDFEGDGVAVVSEFGAEGWVERERLTIRTKPTPPGALPVPLQAVFTDAAQGHTLGRH